MSDLSRVRPAGAVTCNCRIDHGPGDTEEIIKCSLCLAAPELLEACKKAVNELQAQNRLTGRGSDVVAFVCEAISKAEGYIA